MALGILEPPVEHVPGTVNVYEAQEKENERLRTNTSLKRDKTGRIILNPQPSDDPNDPLNWPLWQRDVMFGILCFVAVIATTASPLLAADSITMARVFKTSFPKAAYLTAYHLAGVAAGALIAVPFARVFGKRGLFLFGALLMTATSAWAGSTRYTGYKYTSMMWARIFQGVALAPFESLVNAVVGDLYFVTERGPRMAVANVCLFGGAFMTPVVVGKIVATPALEWQWTFFFLAIFMAVGFVLLFFFVPETAYKRAAYLETDLASSEDLPKTANSTPSWAVQTTDEKHIHSVTVDDPAPTMRDPYWKRLLPYNGIKSDDFFLVLLVRPFPLFCHPAILWACLMQGVIIGWTVMVGVIISVIFLGPPLFYNEEKTGRMYVSAFIGSVLGLVLSGIYTEVVTRFLVARNKGRYEPEFRLMLVIPTLITTAIGLYGFGITAGDVTKYGWLPPEIFLGFLVLSMVMGAIASAQYILDAHRDLAVEAFTCMIIFKNVFSFVLAFFAYDWVFGAGISHMFTIFGSIEVAICVLSVPMYVFGKYNREFFHRHDILRMCKLR